jgi:ATPases involved in chromosome partitioning
MVTPVKATSQLRTLGRALVITVGVSKGGTGKSWIATNLAATLARKGHHTVLVDSNTAANSHSDWAFMAHRGQNPGFHCYFDPEPFSSGLIDELKSNFDVIVIDTPQYRHVHDISRAWEESELLVAPVTEDAPDFRFFLSELNGMDQLRGGKPIAVIPTRCTMLKRQTITRAFNSFLDQLEEAGTHVPRFEKGNYHLDYNQRVKSLPVRNIYYRPTPEDHCKPVEAWTKKWEVHVDWLLEVLRAEEITLPAPKGEVDALDQFRETVTQEHLKNYGLLVA